MRPGISKMALCGEEPILLNRQLQSVGSNAVLVLISIVLKIFRVHRQQTELQLVRRKEHWGQRQIETDSLVQYCCPKDWEQSPEHQKQCWGYSSQ